MAIRIEKSFVVKAPAGAVWEFLTDPRRVARCLAGAAITEQIDDTTYAGTMTVKVGPVTASYRGKLRFERLDAAAREAEIAASGQETRGKGGADMRMTSRVVERSPGETEVTVTSDVNVVGVLAQFGGRMIQDVSDQLFQKFTEAMRRELEAPAGAAAAAPAAASEAAGPVVPAAAATEDVVVVPAATTAAAADRAVDPQAPPVATEPALDLGALGAAAAGRAAARTLRRPAFWIAVAVLAAVVSWLILR
jgi:hypothetical protein